MPSTGSAKDQIPSETSISPRLTLAVLLVLRICDCMLLSVLLLPIKSLGGKPHGRRPRGGKCVPAADPSAAVENREAVVRSLFIRPADPTIPSGHLPRRTRRLDCAQWPPSYTPKLVATTSILSETSRMLFCHLNVMQTISGQRMLFRGPGGELLLGPFPWMRFLVLMLVATAMFAFSFHLTEGRDF